MEICPDHASSPCHRGDGIAYACQNHHHVIYSNVDHAFPQDNVMDYAVYICHLSCVKGVGQGAEHDEEIPNLSMNYISNHSNMFINKFSLLRGRRVMRINLWWACPIIMWWQMHLRWSHRPD